jgi:AcrR family transcriptional regulator
LEAESGKMLITRVTCQTALFVHSHVTQSGWRVGAQKRPVRRVALQVLDEQKRSKILSAAAKQFSRRPFHKVLLSEVAESAGVGKGTLYIYFENKEDLYLSVLYSGFAQLVDGMRQRLDQNQLDPMENLSAAIREIVQFAYRNPHMFDLMRTVSWRDVVGHANWNNKRMELKALIESIIRSGISRGMFFDPHPALTTRYITGMVRSVLIDGTQHVDPQILTDHMIHFVRKALENKPVFGQPVP